jgi:hypothetical protein
MKERNKKAKHDDIKTDDVIKKFASNEISSTDDDET